MSYNPIISTIISVLLLDHIANNFYATYLLYHIPLSLRGIKSQRRLISMQHFLHCIPLSLGGICREYKNLMQTFYHVKALKNLLFVSNQVTQLFFFLVLSPRYCQSKHKK